jgi:hypothetical protein
VPATTNSDEAAAWDGLEHTGKTSNRWAKWSYDTPETVTTREQLVERARKRSVDNGEADHSVTTVLLPNR